MTEDKGFKRLVRRRAQQTGASYTATRRHLLATSRTDAPRSNRRLVLAHPGLSSTDGSLNDLIRLITLEGLEVLTPAACRHLTISSLTAFVREVDPALVLVALARRGQSSLGITTEVAQARDDSSFQEVAARTPVAFFVSTRGMPPPIRSEIAGHLASVPVLAFLGDLRFAEQIATLQSVGGSPTLREWLGLGQSQETNIPKDSSPALGNVRSADAQVGKTCG